jgi:hypothetical protein
MDSFEESRRNDRDGLRFLDDFGWLRTVELGGLLWPRNKSSRQQADRLARRWIDLNLVLVRKLPDGAGRSLVLSAAGVRRLAEFDVTAQSGKDIGQVQAGKWTPPQTWRHDLLAVAVLVELHKNGYTVLPEHKIRRLAGRLVKIPDGLAFRGQEVIWLEAENSRKSGPELRRLAEALGTVTRGLAEPVLGLKPTRVMVAFPLGIKDENEHNLSHQLRVRNGLAKHCRQSTPLTWAKCTIFGSAGVGEVVFEAETVNSDRAAAIALRLNASGWHLAGDGVLESSYSGYTVTVWEDENGWSFCAEPGKAGYVDNITEAKRACANELVRLGC